MATRRKTSGTRLTSILSTAPSYTPPSYTTTSYPDFTSSYTPPPYVAPTTKYEPDPYEAVEATPGYEAIVGLDDRFDPFRAALSGDAYNLAGDRLDVGENMISQSVIDSLIANQDYLWDVSESGQYWGAGTYPDETAGAGGIIPPPTPSGPSGPGPIEWIIGDYEVGGQGPDWWKPFTLKDPANFSNPSVAATLMMNALIGSGSLSDEDARSMAKQLYAIWGSHEQPANPWDVYSTKFGERGEAGGGPTMQGTFDPRISRQQQLLGQTGPGVIDPDWKFSRGRSEQALGALSKMREATVGGNVHEFGPGYQYLQEVAGTLGETGTADTRAKQLQILGALDPMMAQSKAGELSGFSAAAQMLANPFFTNLPPDVSRTQAGDYQFGRQSKHLFF